MRRKIKFPLIMKDGISVRNIEELREYFDLEKIINYYIDGKLQKWLQDRNYENELNNVLSLDKNSSSFNQDLCKLFSVVYTECDINIEKSIEKNARINKLKQYVDYSIWIEKIDDIMLDQNELDNRLILLNEWKKLSSSQKTKTDIFERFYNQIFKNEKYKMYLCGEKFNVNDEFENIEYIGINNPEISISGNEIFDADTKNILFNNVRLTSDRGMTIKVKDIKGCSIDKSKVNIKNKIDVKYNKTIIKHFSNNLIVLDEEGKVHFLGSFCSGEKCVPQNLPKIVDIDSALSIVVALDENGKVHQWGKLPYKFASVPNDLPKIKQVTVNGNLVVVLGEDGKIYYWGGFDCEKVFRGYEMYGRIQYIKMPKITSKIIQIANSGSVVVALDENGKVHSWGNVNSKIHNIPSNLPPIKKLVLNHDDFALALDENGKIHHWGRKDYGVDKIPKDLPKVVDISCNGIEYSALDEDGKIHIWGDYPQKWKDIYDEVQKLPKLRSVCEYGGVDENGKAHGSLRRGSELDSIKIMNPRY